MALIIDAPDFSDEELLAVHAEGALAAEVFQETLMQLVDEITSIDALQILARAGFFLMARGADRVDQPKSGVLHMFHVELLQALALTKARGVQKPNGTYPDVTSKIIELIDKNGDAHRGRAKLKIGKEKADNHKQELLRMMQDWTLAVRGVRLGHQTDEYVADLATLVNDSFRHHYDCDATQVVRVFSHLLDEIKQRLFSWGKPMLAWRGKKTGIGMIEAFTKQMSAEDGDAVKALTLPHRRNPKTVFAILWNLCEDQLIDLYTFNIDELVRDVPPRQLDAVKAVIRGLSLGFGDVKPDTLEYLHLSNPIRLQPLIRLDDERIFCALPQVVGSQMAEILETLCAAHPTLKSKAEKARADWLEARLAKLVRRYLPSAKVYEKVKWQDGKEWESDVVAVLDETVVVFEAKSAKIADPARRGAVGSLKEALKELVVGPSEQSLRFKQRIMSATYPVQFEAAGGITLILDNNKVRDIVRINVLQDAIGPLSSHWPDLKRAGLIPDDVDVAPSMSIFDLECVFDALTMEVERCHYLIRRGELERNCRYIADELDLLSMYIKSQFNIYDDEFSSERHPWYGQSLAITPSNSGRISDDIRRAKIERTDHWQNLLNSLENLKPDGWTRFAYRLLNVDFGGQRQVDRILKEGFRDVGKNPHLLFQSGITTGPKQRLTTIALLIGKPYSAENFNMHLHSAATSAMEQSGQDNLLALYSFYPKTGEPYDYIGTLFAKDP